MQMTVATSQPPVGRWPSTPQASRPAKIGALPTASSVAMPTPTSSTAWKNVGW